MAIAPPHFRCVGRAAWTSIVQPVPMMLRRPLRLFALVFLLPLALHAIWWLPRGLGEDWHSADWSSAGVLPAASASPAASVHIYCAPTGRWKGVFAVHSWIVVKEAGARRYSRFDVAGWGRPIKTDGWAPDARWFGNEPRLVAVVQGAEAARLIPKIRASIARYPYGHAGDYLIWPGPNSNTFVAEVLAQIPEAGIVLPANAIGKDFRGSGLYAGWSPSGTGVQVSVFGLLGVIAGWNDGLEVNVLGLVAGIDWRRGGVKLPGWGTLALGDLWPATARAGH
jgi:hypothetical protein